MNPWLHRDALLRDQPELGLRGYLRADTRPTTGFRPQYQRLSGLTPMARAVAVRQRRTQLRLGDIFDQPIDPTGEFTAAQGLYSLTAGSVSSALSSAEATWQEMLNTRAGDVNWFTQNGNSLSPDDQAAYTAGLAGQINAINQFGTILNAAKQGAQKLGFVSSGMSGMGRGLGIFGLDDVTAGIIALLAAAFIASVTAVVITGLIAAAWAWHEKTVQVQARAIQTIAQQEAAGQVAPGTTAKIAGTQALQSIGNWIPWIVGGVIGLVVLTR